MPPKGDSVAEVFPRALEACELSLFQVMEQQKSEVQHIF